MVEIFATKKISASQIDELGLSVLIKSCDRLGDAEWAVTILKESIKAGLRVDFSIYQRVFAILVKSPNAAQAAVDMLLNIEKAAIIIKRQQLPISPSSSPAINNDQENIAKRSQNESQVVNNLIENLSTHTKDIGLNPKTSKDIIDEVRRRREK